MQAREGKFGAAHLSTYLGLMVTGAEALLSKRTLNRLSPISTAHSTKDLGLYRFPNLQSPAAFTFFGASWPKV